MTLSTSPMTPQTQPLRALVIRHCTTLAERVRALGSILSSLSNGGDFPAQIREGRALAHQIHGASGSIGFDRLSNLASSVEDKLAELQTSTGLATEVKMAELAELFGELEAVTATTKPEHSRLYDADLGPVGVHIEPRAAGAAQS